MDIKWVLGIAVFNKLNVSVKILKIIYSHINFQIHF